MRTKRRGREPGMGAPGRPPRRIIPERGFHASHGGGTTKKLQEVRQRERRPGGRRAVPFPRPDRWGVSASRRPPFVHPKGAPAPEPETGWRPLGAVHGPPVRLVPCPETPSPHSCGEISSSLCPSTAGPSALRAPSGLLAPIRHTGSRPPPRRVRASAERAGAGGVGRPAPSDGEGRACLRRVGGRTARGGRLARGPAGDHLPAARTHAGRAGQPADRGAPVVRARRSVRRRAALRRPAGQD